MFCLAKKRKKKSQKKLGCCPDPHLCRGKCVRVCLSIYITKYPSSQPFVCVCFCAFQWIKFKKCASLLTFWWIVQFYWTKVKSSEIFKSSSNQPFCRLSPAPPPVDFYTHSLFTFLRKIIVLKFRLIF